MNQEDLIQYLTNIIEGNKRRKNQFKSDFYERDADILEYDNTWSLRIRRLDKDSSYYLYGDSRDVDVFLDWVSYIVFDISSRDSLLKNNNFYYCLEQSEDQFNSYKYIVDVRCGYGSSYDGLSSSFLFNSEETLNQIIQRLTS